MEDAKVTDTSIGTFWKMGIDESGPSMNETMIRGIISSLLYFTASRLDIEFGVGMCAIF